MERDRGGWEEGNETSQLLRYLRDVSVNSASQGPSLRERSKTPPPPSPPVCPRYSYNRSLFHTVCSSVVCLPSLWEQPSAPWGSIIASHWPLKLPSFKPHWLQKLMKFSPCFLSQWLGGNVLFVYSLCVFHSLSLCLPLPL